MGQTIKGKGVVSGKYAERLIKALENPQPATEKSETMQRALKFHKEVKVIK